MSIISPRSDSDPWPSVSEVWLVEVAGEQVPEEGLGEAGFALVESQRRVASSQVHRLLKGAGMNEEK